MGHKNFFGGFYLQGKNGFKGQKSIGQKPYKNFNRIMCSKGPKFKSFLKTDLPSYGQTLKTEHRKMGRENFSFGFCPIKNSNRTFSFETAHRGSKGHRT